MPGVLLGRVVKCTVIPAKAGILTTAGRGSRLRGNDEKGRSEAPAFNLTTPPNGPSPQWSIAYEVTDIDPAHLEPFAGPSLYGSTSSSCADVPGSPLKAKALDCQLPEPAPPPRLGLFVKLKVGASQRFFSSFPRRQESLCRSSSSTTLA